MIYPKNFEQKIGFSSIREILKEACISPLGEKFVDKIRFSSNFELIKKLLSQVEEFRQILLFGEQFPSQDYFDLRPELKRINIEGTFIEQELLVDLRLSLNTITSIISYIKNLEIDEFPFLNEIIENVIIDKNILIKINAIIDEKGRIKDNASAKLQSIRSELISKQSVIDKKINKTLLLARKSGWAAEFIEPTIRNGRLVIPMHAANKRMIKGFIHDESSTGKTVYVEPAEVFEINNDLRELENAEKREIIKILTDLTNFIRPNSEQLISNYHFLGIIDFIRAKAKFALLIEANKPHLMNKPLINWTDAKHPLLFLSHKAQKKPVVPLDISLDDKNRILIISGPNAGGKSVCLKTVGLLQYMLQSGLLIPTKESSSTGIFTKFFIDIGDEQSLENDLSTYSSHLLNLKFFINHSDNRSLILIDEFGTGTEPQLGGAIAEATLEKINQKKSFAVITTHYTNLKLVASKTDGIFNGAMLFDTKTMTPLYKLRLGMPGSSFAFEIARKIGFQKEVLRNAVKKTGKTQIDYDKALQDLEVEKSKLKEGETKQKFADEFLSDMIDKYQKLKNELEAKKETFLQQAKNEALQLISNSNKLIEKTIKEIREDQADKEKTKKLRENLKKESEKIKAKEITNKKKPKTKKKIQEKTPLEIDKIIKVGDFVSLEGQTSVSEVAEIIGKDAIISSDSIRLRVPLKMLKKTVKKAVSYRKQSYGNIINELNQKMANFNLSIDVRGKRSEEALSLVRKYIDDAILLNVRDVSILHGKGDGILRQLIREYLSSVTEIKQYKDQHIEFGGHGITLVSLK